MDNVTRELLVKELVTANEEVLKKYELKNVKWEAMYFLDSDEEVMASNVSGHIGARSKPE